MDPKRAYEILGIEPGTPRQDIRRAYLRLVREHSPEADPEGFARVRAAFDTLRRAPSEKSSVLPTQAEAAQPEASEARAQSTSRGESASYPFRSLPRDTHADVLEELREIHPLAIERRAELVANAFFEAPKNTELFWLAVEELSPYRSVRARLRDVLRRGVDECIEGALEPLTFYAPDLLEAQELTTLARDESLDRRLWAARVHLAKRDVAAAEAIFVSVLSASSPETVPLAGLLDLAVQFGQAAAIDAMERACAGIKTFFATHQTELGLVPHAAFQWGLARELVELSAVVPESSIMAVARLARGHDAEHATVVGETLLKNPQKPKGQKMLNWLSAHTPLIFQLTEAETAFQGLGSGRVSPRELFGALGLLFLIGTVRVALIDSCRSPDPSDWAARKAIAVSTERGRMVTRKIGELRAEYERHCGSFGHQQLGHANRQDCTKMERALRALTFNPCADGVPDSHNYLRQAGDVLPFVDKVRQVAPPACALIRRGGRPPRRGRTRK